jgi:hypothetical protein
LNVAVGVMPVAPIVFSPSASTGEEQSGPGRTAGESDPRARLSTRPTRRKAITTHISRGLDDVAGKAIFCSREYCTPQLAQPLDANRAEFGLHSPEMSSKDV